MKKILFTLVLFCVLISFVIVELLYYENNVINDTFTQALAIDTNTTSESVIFIANTMNNFSFQIYKQIS